jgi:hypothetical protein
MTTDFDRISGASQVPIGLVPREPSIVKKMCAAVFAGRLDREVEARVTPEPTSMLAAHIARLTSGRERTALALSLRNMLVEIGSGRPTVTARVPINRPNAAQARPFIVEIIHRLEGHRRVRPRGVARLRLLLTDGAGPVYTRQGGDLSAHLKGVIAAL